MIERAEFIDWNGYRYWYVHRLGKDHLDICLGTEDPKKYCNGLYLFSRKDPGDGMAFVVVYTTDPNHNFPEVNKNKYGITL